MARFDDLAAFAAVVRVGSFTRAAAQMGVTQSALSQTVRSLERRLDLKLLNRTTRSVSPTEAGERLYQAVSPRFADIEAELAVLGELRGKPAGTVRITATEHAVRTLLWPRLQPWLPKFPDIKVELSSDNRFIDIVAERFDIGVRLGGDVAKDMIAVRIAPDMRLVVVGSPFYFEHHPLPAPAVPRWAVALGVQASRQEHQRSRHGSIGLQFQRHDRRGCVGWTRASLGSRGCGQRVPRRWAPGLRT